MNLHTYTAGSVQDMWNRWRYARTYLHTDDTAQRCVLWLTHGSILRQLSVNLGTLLQCGSYIWRTRLASLSKHLACVLCRHGSGANCLRASVFEGGGAGRLVRGHCLPVLLVVRQLSGQGQSGHITILLLSKHPPPSKVPYMYFFYFYISKITTQNLQCLMSVWKQSQMLNEN